MEAPLEHPWLGTVWRHSADELIATVNVPTTIRPARDNGDTDVEVLIKVTGTAQDLLALADNAATRVQAALASLQVTKAYAAEYDPVDRHEYYPPAVPAPLIERLFLEGFTITDTYTEIAFDYGDLDMIVVRTAPDGRCLSVHSSR